MAGEFLTPQDKSIPVTITTIHDEKRGEGTGLTIHSTPTTEFKLFPSGMEISNETFTVTVPGEPQLRVGNSGMSIETIQDAGTSKTMIQDGGRIVFEYTPRTMHASKESLLSPSSPKQGHKENNYDELFSTVSVEDPTTFAPLTFGLTLKYFRTNEGLTQAELAERAGYSTATVLRHEKKQTGGRQGMLIQYINGFGWKKDDPRLAILTNKFEEKRK